MQQHRPAIEVGPRGDSLIGTASVLIGGERDELRPTRTGALLVAYEYPEDRFAAPVHGERVAAEAADGLAALGEHPPAALRPHWQRLRVCHAGALIQSGEVEQGRALLQALVIETDPGSVPWAMAAR